jgi:hypothetical protein
MSDVKITRFAPGQAVPDWLLDQEPAQPDAIKGPITFADVADVIETPDYFVLVPFRDAAGIVTIEGRGNLVFAATKPVRVLIQQSVIFPIDMRDAGAQASWVSPPRMIARRPGFWSRLRDLFR